MSDGVILTITYNNILKDLNKLNGIQFKSTTGPNSDSGEYETKYEYESLPENINSINDNIKSGLEEAHGGIIVFNGITNANGNELKSITKVHIGTQFYPLLNIPGNYNKNWPQGNLIIEQGEDYNPNTIQWYVPGQVFPSQQFSLQTEGSTTPITVDENNPFTLNNIQSSKNHTFVFKLPLLGNYYNEQESASDKFTNVKLRMYNNNTPQVSYNVPKTQTSYTDNNSNGKPTKIKISFDLKKADASVIYNSEDTTEWNIEFSAKDQLGRDVKKTWSNVFNIHKDKPKFVSLEIKVEKETNPPTYTLPLYGKTDKITIVGTVNKSLKNTTGTSPQLKLNINDINDNSVYAKTTSTTTTTNTTTITFEYTVQSGDYIDKNNQSF